ncbi:hypothetical protein BU15DRAFT_67976 [Melanogaster broomeanus]|nr:hypothetical protein BU15DRAFT_67976 [Melanogaster broomeanus]
MPNTSPMTDMPCLEPKHCVRRANIVYGVQTLHVGLIQYEPKRYMRGANVVCVAHPSMKVLPTTQIPAGAATLGCIAGKPIDKHGLIGSVELCRMPMHATTTCSHDDDDSPTCTQRPIMPTAHPHLHTTMTQPQPMCLRDNHSQCMPTTQRSRDSNDAT